MDKHRNQNRSRKYGIVIHLSEDEKYILDEKTKCSGMKSRSAFIRHLILYGFVYDVDYSELREYNAALAKIGNNLNQIANCTKYSLRIERYRQRIRSRRKRSKGADAKGMAYT